MRTLLLRLKLDFERARDQVGRRRLELAGPDLAPRVHLVDTPIYEAEAPILESNRPIFILAIIEHQRLGNLCKH